MKKKNVFLAMLFVSALTAGANAFSAETGATAPSASAGGETGTIIFFRPAKFVGAAVGYKVREGDKELGKLRNGKYFTLKVAPGKHEYVVHSEAKDILTIEVEAGQTYYVMGTLGMGIVAGRPNLSPSDASAFEAAKAKLKEVAPLSDDDEDEKPEKAEKADKKKKK